MRAAYFLAGSLLDELEALLEGLDMLPVDGVLLEDVLLLDEGVVEGAAPGAIVLDEDDALGVEDGVVVEVELDALAPALDASDEAAGAGAVGAGETVVVDEVEAAGGVAGGGVTVVELDF